MDLRNCPSVYNKQRWLVSLALRNYPSAFDSLPLLNLLACEKLPFYPCYWPLLDTVLKLQLYLCCLIEL